MIDFRDLDVMSRTIFGEARGEPIQGQIAVANVIVNRFRSGKWFAGKTIADTCQKPMQFSCWNEGDPTRARMVSATITDLQPFYDIAINVLWGAINDPSLGATHYYADTIAAPAWSKGKIPTTKIGHHLFFKDID